MTSFWIDVDVSSHMVHSLQQSLQYKFVLNRLAMCWDHGSVDSSCHGVSQSPKPGLGFHITQIIWYRHAGSFQYTPCGLAFATLVSWLRWCFFCHTCFFQIWFDEHRGFTWPRTFKADGAALRDQYFIPKLQQKKTAEYRLFDGTIMPSVPMQILCPLSLALVICPMSLLLSARCRAWPETLCRGNWWWSSSLRQDIVTFVLQFHDEVIQGINMGHLLYEADRASFIAKNFKEPKNLTTTYLTLISLPSSLNLRCHALWRLEVLERC